MRNEISAAVLFLVQLIEKNEKFSPDQLDCFQRRMVELMTERFQDHWFPDKPFKGQGYRCIRVNGHNRRDATIERAANAAGVRYEDLSLPVELTLWVDPKEVCCRFGESKGSYCTLASFDDKENMVPLITKRIEKIEKEVKQVNQEKPGSNSETTNNSQQKSKPLNQLNTNTTSNGSSNSSTNSSSSSNNNNSNNNGPNKRRNLNSPRLHLNRNRSWFNHSFMGYGPHPMSQPWYNVMPPHFIGGPSPPPFIGGHRASKWIHSSSYPSGPSRFHHWSPKATLKV
ncbi:maternal B9.10 protein isoform X1 [Copidosoma floridanum]|uniref:maternal B9.10 protein isoform X1 n=1 Tax=Copidosoma floridanum TaxID=29053 RepID=UPI0006C96F34|nr:maternal B9.10 protein isoform X1 [Copidosoma floridanum]XP_014219478.1 maternal B9.10 protein isoform X1 [Copidosoma floridanum]